MTHSKRHSSLELTFTAPFGLRLCQQRLLSKAKRASKSWFRSAMRVEVFRLNDETLEFYAKRGVAMVRGRLDKLDDKSTQVNFSASMSWMRQLPKLVFTLAVLFACGAARMLSLMFTNWFPGAYTDDTTLHTTRLVCSDGQCYLPAASLQPLYDAAQLHLLIAGVVAFALTLVLIGYRARVARSQLAREIETALTDQITDLPDVSALETDGEIVFTPNLAYRETSVAADDLTGLLKPKSGNSKRE